MYTIGFATIAESPRDDVVPSIQEFLPPGTKVVERGNLNGLTNGEIESLAPESGEAGLVARRIRDAGARQVHAHFAAAAGGGGPAPGPPPGGGGAGRAPPRGG
jgi:hypothetical protein